MNIQTDPSLLKGVIEPLPASADQPIRSTFFHEANMRKFGEELAQSTPAVPGLTTFDFQRRIRENGKKILEVYRATNDAQAKGEVITPAAQWLLDNHYLIEETVFQVKRDLPRRFYRELPVASFGGGQPLPRALAHRLGLCRAFRQLGLGLDVRGDRRRLPVGRAAEDRRIVGAAVAAALRADREPAPAGVARQPHPRDAQHRQQARRPYRRRRRRRRPGRASSRATPRMRATPPSPRSCSTGCATARAMPGARWSGSRTSSNSHGTNAEAMIIAEHQTLSAGNVTTGNIVSGLRLINDVDWTVWFEKVSRVDALLREQALFADLDFHSRDHYRAEIEELARGSGITEYAVAEQAIAMAREAAAGRSRHVGHRFLPGRRASRRARSGDRLPAAVRHAASSAPTARPAGRASSARPLRSPRSCCP